MGAIERASLLLALCLLLSAGADAKCKEVTTVEDFDYDAYISKKWYVHQVEETIFMPAAQNHCVTSSFEKLTEPTLLGYTSKFLAYSRFADGTVKTKDLCVLPGETPGKMTLGPCFLPQMLAGPFWVVAYDEEEGYALASTGQPTKPGPDGSCSGKGVGKGLWITTRSPVRDEALIAKVRGIAKDAGFDPSVLNDVDHGSCGQECTEGGGREKGGECEASDA